MHLLQFHIFMINMNIKKSISNTHDKKIKFPVLKANFFVEFLSFYFIKINEINS